MAKVTKTVKKVKVPSDQDKALVNLINLNKDVVENIKILYAGMTKIQLKVDKLLSRIGLSDQV